MPASEILCWCLMPNHFHFVIMATDKGCKEVPAFGGKGLQVLSKNIGKMLSSYTQAINKQRGSTGSIFQQKTKAKPVFEAFDGVVKRGTDQHYLANVIEYVHENPVRAGLVTEADNWQFSSYRDHAGMRNGSLCNTQLMADLILGNRSGRPGR